MSNRFALALFALGLVAVVSSSSARAAPYVGCYLDDDTRALDAFLGYGHTVESCTDAARAAGYDYAGLQYYGQCFGGDQVGFAARPATECNTPCTANSAQTCGGPWRNSIYATAAMPSTCVKDGNYVTCAAQTCGVTACWDAQMTPVSCPAAISGACGAAPVRCLKNNWYQPCAGLTCGVQGCYDYSYNQVSCPAGVQASCETPTYCVKDGAWASCAAQTCGVQTCYNQQVQVMACPANLTQSCDVPTLCKKDGFFSACANLTCGVTECVNQQYAPMTCPSTLTQACDVLTTCKKNGVFGGCANQTCGVTECRNQAGAAMTCPSSITGACPATTYEGYLDSATCGNVHGWVWAQPVAPATDTPPVQIEILDGTQVIATMTADLLRSDLIGAGKGNGRHAFSWSLPPLTGAHTLQVRVAGASWSLYGSPKAVTCTATSSAAGRLEPVAYLHNPQTGAECSGTIIGPRTVLTAAHCDLGTPIYVYYKGRTASAIGDRLAAYPGFDAWRYLDPETATWTPDLALYSLREPVSVTPAKIRSGAPALNGGITLAGFGKTPTAPTGGVLRHAFQTISRVDAAFVRHTGVGSCQNDSGGAMLLGTAAADGVCLAGVISWNIPNPNLPAPTTPFATITPPECVFGGWHTRIDGAAIRAWIRQTAAHDTIIDC